MSKEEEKKPKGFKKAKKKAQSLLSQPKKVKKLLADAEQKAKARSNKLQSVWEDFQALLRLLKAWRKGLYKDIPWKSILYITASIIYFVNPLDLVPDFIPITGLLDDLTILTFVINSIKEDLVKFKNWEEKQQSESNSS